MCLLAEPQAAMFSWSTSAQQASTVQSTLRSGWPSTSSLGQAILGNLKRSPLYHSLTSLDRTKLWSRFYVDDEDNVQKVLDVVSEDQKVITDPTLNTNRRTVIVKRNEDEAFGFTLQTYLLKRTEESIPEKVSYIDYVQLDSPAAEAGIRPGDVIVSINGRVVTEMNHKALIKLIGSCREMRVVLIYTNVRERIELTARAIRLRKLLNDKLFQLNLIDVEEQRILNRAYLRSLAAEKMKKTLNGSLSSEATSSTSSILSAGGGEQFATNEEKDVPRPPHSDAPTGELPHRPWTYKQPPSYDSISLSSIHVDVSSSNSSEHLSAVTPTCEKTTLDSVNLKHIIHIEEVDGQSVLVSKF